MESNHITSKGSKIVVCARVGGKVKKLHGKREVIRKRDMQREYKILNE